MSIPGFYDPLYEYITVDRQWRIDDDTELAEFVNSIEFCRQMFLRQNGMGCFVFPSATHTRFAHALGACHLGFVAAERCRVLDTHSGKTLSLGEFLRSHGWMTTFGLSLLLHDIGHFAFSHTLEHNTGLWSYLKADHGIDHVSHEEATCSLICGMGWFFEAAVRRNQSLPQIQGVDHVHNIIHRQIPRPGRVQNAICFLITGASHYLNGLTDHEKFQLRVIHELVSGLLDLDRVDHYRRDIYFNGLAPGTGLNYMSLLDGITVVYENSTRNGRLILSGDAFGQAVALLQMKGRLSSNVFHNPAVLANETMLNHAISQYVREQKLKADAIFDLLYSTDEELLQTLSQGGSDVRKLVHRIRARVPYMFLHRIDCMDWPRRPSEVSLTYVDVVQRELDSVEPGLLFAFTGSWEDTTQQISSPSGDLFVPNPDKEWLLYSRLDIDAERSQVVDKSTARRQLEALQSDRNRYLWIFRENQCGDEERKRLITSIESRLSLDIVHH